MTARQLVAFAGAALLIFGVFAPIISIPIMGNMNYFQNGKGDGIIVLALAGVSLLLALARAFKGLWATGTGCAATLVFTFVSFQSKLSEMQSQMNSELSGNPFRGIADAAMQAVQLQWGWAFLILGTLALFAAAAMRETKAMAADCPHCAGVVPVNQPACNHCGNAVSWIEGKARKPSRAAA